MLERPLTAQFRVYLSPAQVLALGFGLVIVMGALLLNMGMATEDGQGLTFVDALFTSTSAVCVTGLIVADTATTFSIFGEVVILFLIQVGGLGIMTMSTLFALIMGKRISFRERLLIKESLGILSVSGVVRLVRYVLLMTLVAEGLGAVLLTIVFSSKYPYPKAVYLGVFHAVSAFNNAGFDLLSTSFTDYVTHPLLNITVMFLIIVGGLGFTVVLEMWERARGQQPDKKRDGLSLHTRLTIVVTIVLVVFGAAVVMVSEYSNPATIGELPLGSKVMASFFLSVTSRTAGFNTVPTGGLRPLTLLVTIILMWIGGSAGSTAGGIKTTTFASILAAIWGTITGKVETQVFQRRLARDVVGQAWAVASMSTVVVLTIVGALLVTEQAPLMDVMFEATSAFGTVGLTTGITSSLSSVGKLVVTAGMYIGRLGPLTLAVAVARRQKHKLRIKHPKERIMVG